VSGSWIRTQYRPEGTPFCRRKRTPFPSRPATPSCSCNDAAGNISVPLAPGHAFGHDFARRVHHRPAERVQRRQPPDVRIDGKAPPLRRQICTGGISRPDRNQFHLNGFAPPELPHGQAAAHGQQRHRRSDRPAGRRKPAARVLRPFLRGFIRCIRFHLRPARGPTHGFDEALLFLHPFPAVFTEQQVLLDSLAADAGKPLEQKVFHLLLRKAVLRGSAGQKTLLLIILVPV